MNNKQYETQNTPIKLLFMLGDEGDGIWKYRLGVLARL